VLDTIKSSWKELDVKRKRHTLTHTGAIWEFMQNCILQFKSGETGEFQLEMKSKTLKTVFCDSTGKE
jgi:hypothetical protein